MPSIEEIKIQNNVAVHTLGKMLKNYVDCLVDDDIAIKLLPKEYKDQAKYHRNKLKSLAKAIDVVIQPVERFLSKSGGSDAVEKTIFKYHETVDEVFGLTEDELNRVNKLIAKIKKERKEQLSLKIA
ncbi:hypothetical protein D3C80_1040120 [compost metagenome]